MPLPPRPSLPSFFESLKLQKKSMFFSGNSHIFEIDRSSGTLWIWRWHCLVYILSHLSKSSIYSGQEILCASIKVIMQNEVNSIKFSISLPFCAGPSLPGLANVSVWQSCGKPSTKFPHGGLVECLFIAHISISPSKLL